MAERVAARFRVSGRVQAVFFRASAQAEAERLGLQGYARNLPDGRVEVLAVGAAGAVESLAEWLREGPPMAAVESVERTPAEADGAPAGFKVRHS